MLLFKSLVLLAAATAEKTAPGVSPGASGSSGSPAAWGDYPPWLLVLVATIVLAVFIWIMLRLVKLALWTMLIAVIVVGLGTVVWLVVK